VGKATLESVSTGERPKLPRGPHALPQDVVIAHQRERLLVATAEALAEQGYAELTVRDMIGRAGISRRTFYQLYDDKLACVLAAHAMALDGLLESISGACSEQVTWPDGVAAGVGGALEFAVRSPSEARLVLLASHTVSEPKLMDAAIATHERLESLLRTGRQRCDEARSPVETTESALIGAATTVVGSRLSAGHVDGLQQLGPELVQIILAPYLGYEEAQRVAHAAAA
jgi:AcrR family transcriptional regulator